MSNDSTTNMSGDRTLIGIILIIVVIWLALNILGDFLNLIGNSFIVAIVVIALILWYFDVI